MVLAYFLLIVLVILLFLPLVITFIFGKLGIIFEFSSRNLWCLKNLVINVPLKDNFVEKVKLKAKSIKLGIKKKRFEFIVEDLQFLVEIKRQ